MTKKKKKNHYDISFYEILNILIYGCKYRCDYRKIRNIENGEKTV